MNVKWIFLILTSGVLNSNETELQKQNKAKIKYTAKFDIHKVVLDREECSTLGKVSKEIGETSLGFFLRLLTEAQLDVCSSWSHVSHQWERCLLRFLASLTELQHMGSMSLTYWIWFSLSSSGMSKEPASGSVLLQPQLNTRVQGESRSVGPPWHPWWR